MKNALKIFALLMTLCALQTLTACGPRTGGTGATGLKGDVGAVGPTGGIGQPGADANPVTVVQLCEGTTTYPNTFVEVGYCINGNVYATFSANGGFSTMLPPGSYASNAVGSSCNFTVGLNCQISH